MNAFEQRVAEIAGPIKDYSLHYIQAKLAMFLIFCLQLSRILTGLPVQHVCPADVLATASA
ncbi:MAG TPA: hypothetical protein PK580_03045 [Nitrosomonas halophila]|nr:hypothetical protein [Nitrosomonas halophila]